MVSQIVSKSSTPWPLCHCCTSLCLYIKLTFHWRPPVYLSGGWSSVYLSRSEQGPEWCVEKAETRRPWILRIYRSCLAGDLLFAAFTAETVNLSWPNLLPLLFPVHLSFSAAVFQHFSLSLASLFVVFFFCWITTVHDICFIWGNCLIITSLTPLSAFVRCSTLIVYSLQAGWMLTGWNSALSLLSLSEMWRWIP